MTPLRITATLAEPVIYYGDGMHLDGPLSYAAYMSMDASARASLPPMGSDWAIDMDLPLLRWRCSAPEGVDHRLLDADGLLWGWCASAAHADWMAESKVYIRRRTAAGKMQRYTGDGSVNVASGRYKPMNKPYPTAVTREIVWYATGDAVAVGALLAHVPGVGKVVGHGHGRVLSWTVEEHDDDTAWQARRMPATWPGASGYPVHGAVRAPYHHPSRTAECVAPSFETLSPGGPE